MTQKVQHYFDVSSVQNYDYNIVTYVVLTLTNGSTAALVQFRNVSAAAWMSALETSLTLKAAFTGVTTKIAIISDVHIGSPYGSPVASFQAALADMDAIGGINEVFVLGDVVHENAALYGTDANDYKALRATSGIASSHWHELAGNHDVLSGTDGFCAELLGGESALPYYSVTIGNCIFCLLSNEGGLPAISNDAQSWLAAQLAANSEKNCFTMSHQGRLYSTRHTSAYPDAYSGSEYIRNFEPAIGTNDFVAHFSAHSHGYGSVGAPDAGCIYSETSQEDIFENCTLFYELNEGTGTTITPTIGTATGSINGSCAWAVDEVTGENYINIPNTTSDFLSIAHHADLLFGAGPFSILLRAKFDAYGTNREIIEKQGSSGYFQAYWRGTTEKLAFDGGRISPTSSRFGGVQADANIDLSTLYTILIVRDPTFEDGGTCIYVDGVRQQTAELSPMPAADVDDTGATLFVGKGSNGSSALKVYALGFWDVALNRIDAAALNIYPYPSSLLYWPNSIEVCTEIQAQFPTGVVGELYNYTWAIASGPYLSIASGSLPAGLTLENVSSGIYRIHGTPTDSGIYDILIRAAQILNTSPPQYGVYSDKEFTIKIVDGGSSQTGICVVY